MKFVRVLKAYNKPSENNPFGFVNLYHADVFDDNKEYDSYDELFDLAVERGILTEDDLELIREQDKVDGWFLNDTFEENTLKELKKLFEEPANI